MAIDLLSIPAMSAEVERLFFSSKLTISDKRNHLMATTIEAVECLKSWFRLNLFTQEDLDTAMERASSMDLAD